jgi:two-component system LytT family response regulator
MNYRIWSDDEGTCNEIKSQLEQWSSFPNCTLSIADCSSDLAISSGNNNEVHLICLRENNNHVLEKLQELHKVESFVAFIVASECSIASSIELAGLDYLSWPLNLSILRDFENRLRDLHAISCECTDFFSGYSAALQFFASHIRNNSQDEIVLPGVRGYEVFRKEVIVRFESDGPYSWVYTTNGTSVLTNKSLKHFESVLSDNEFVSVSYDHIINLRHMVSHSRENGLTVTLVDGKTIDVSLRRIPLFIQSHAKWSQMKQGGS